MVERRGSWVGCGCNRKLPTHSRQCALCRAAARWHRFHRSLLSRPPASFLGFARAGATCRPSTSGANHQMTLEVRPAHDSIKEYGFVVDTTNLEGSIGVKAARSTSRRRRLPLPNPRKRIGCRRSCRASVPCLRSSPISISRWTTAFSMPPAAAPARCANTMSPIRVSRGLPARCILAAFRDSRRTRTERHMRAARRWLRSAVMANASIGRTRSTPPLFDRASRSSSRQWRQLPRSPGANSRQLD